MECVWLAAVVVFVILEAATYQMVSTWFAIGAVGAVIAVFCGANLYVQFGVFIGISVIMIAVLRPLSMRILKRQDFKSNAEGLIGKNVLITSEVSNIKGTGEGKVNGMTWTVRSDTDEPIPSGQTARIKRIEGVKLIAEKIG